MAKCITGFITKSQRGYADFTSAKTAIYRRLKNYARLKYSKNSSSWERNFTYYAIGPNYIRLISNTPNSSIANVSAIKLPPVSPAFDDDNFGCENCRCSKCCGNFSGYGGNGGGDYYLNSSCENYDSRDCASYDNHRYCEDLANSFNLPTDGFDKISAGLMPVEESASNNVGDYILNAGSLNVKSSELKSQESSFESHEGVIESTISAIESPQGAIESTTSSFKSPQGVINSQEGSLKSQKGISESLTSPSKLTSHTLNDENLTFEPKLTHLRPKKELLSLTEVL